MARIYLRRPVAERFWEKVEKTAGCWLWQGRLSDGYGHFWLDGHQTLAHRVAYTLAVGPIPEGMEIDHVRARGCTSRACVNPAHLEAVTPRENTLRSTAAPAINAAKTQCNHGHAFTAENTCIDYEGRRRCRACAQRRSTAYRLRRRLAS